MVNNYVLTVKLDPTQLNAQIQKIKQAFGGGSNNSNPNQNLSGALGKFQNAIAGLQKAFGGGTGGKLAAFGLMSLGIMELVKLGKSLLDTIVDSSPMLKAMMKLLNVGIMFMLRPIGDFIGYLLRPVLLIFLRYIAIPFYRYFAPWAQRYGTVIGDLLASGLTAMVSFFQDPAGSLKKAFDSLPDTFRRIIDIVFPIAGITDLLTHLPEVSQAFTGFLSLIKPTFKSISDFFSGIPNAFSGALQTAKAGWATVSQFFSGVGSTVSTFLTGSWSTLSAFFTGMGKTITSVITPAWDLLSSFWGGVNSGIKTLLSGWDKAWAFFSDVGSAIDKDLKAAWSAISGFGKYIYNALATVYNAILSGVNSLPFGGAITGGLGLKPMKMMASGGIINEPVFGVGQRSGQGYMLGENGTEVVSKGGSVGNTVHIHIYGGDKQEIRKHVLEVLQESNTRRRKV